MDLERLLVARTLALKRTKGTDRTITAEAKKMVIAELEVVERHREVRLSDVQLNPNMVKHPYRYDQAARFWGKGTYDSVRMLINQPYYFGIIGFAYIGVDRDEPDCMQDIQTIFFPRLTSIIEKDTHGKTTTHEYVMGNRTPYLDLEEPVLVKLEQFLEFVFLPCRKIEAKKQGLSPLSVIT